MTTPTVTHHFDESDTLCVICAEPFREGERILAFGVCNHKGSCNFFLYCIDLIVLFRSFLAGTYFTYGR
jgi:hypothetical protein